MPKGDNINELNSNPQIMSERNRKAGIASGKARRERKEFKQTLEMLLNMPTKNGKLSELESVKNFMDLKGKNVTVQQAISVKLIQDALKGDKKAFELVVAMVGEKPSDRVEIKDITPVVFTGEDELME